MPRLLTARWRYRWQFVTDIGLLASHAMRREGIAPTALLGAVLVLTAWLTGLAALTIWIVRG